MVALFVYANGALRNIHIACCFNPCILAEIGMKNKWDEAYKNADLEQASPSEVLYDNVFLLPEGGDALELACGKAGNAFFLARLDNKSFQVDAVDFSETVIESINQYAKKEKLAVSGIVRDIEEQGLYSASALNKKYDIIVVSHFLNRALFPQIISSLKPNGLLFYQTWSQEKVNDSGPKNKDFRLKTGELLALCSNLIPMSYTENSANGDITKGLRNKAMIVARKPL